MQIPVESRVETRKEWSVPQLKKIDVEQITANGGKNKRADGTNAFRS